ncbi:hypothetical protein FLM48_04885 [Shewanella sp. Scap07]|uniref:hypothetical protein n=1 Tax=Shewanella sp. Scap07 TaxID=2589987 RepID=UPI0015B8DAF8|nr:hypothetical protein [Shewanella sp. Scap07]QLE84482.1 hypothetical protein FLM48_04885 [Shewanella sp. Scap07]
MDKPLIEIVFIVASVLIILAWGVGILVFAQVTVKHLEREMGKEGIEPPRWDRGVGMRLAMYSTIILRPNYPDTNPLVNVAAIKRHSRKIDWFLSMWLRVSFALLCLVSLIYFIFFDQ